MACFENKRIISYFLAKQIGVIRDRAIKTTLAQSVRIGDHRIIGYCQKWNRNITVIEMKIRDRDAETEIIITRSIIAVSLQAIKGTRLRCLWSCVWVVKLDRTDYKESQSTELFLVFASGTAVKHCFRRWTLSTKQSVPTFSFKCGPQPDP